MSTETWLLLSAVLAAGCFVEAVAGFGGTILALSLGSQWFTIEEMLAVFLPLNMVLSMVLAVRGRAAIDREALARRILPLVAVGLAVGTGLAWVVVAERARVAFAVLVVGVAFSELWRQLRPTPRPRRVAIERVLLLGAGVAHGLFASGGPLAVAAISRAMPTKATMRATLAVLWLSLNLMVSTRLVVRGDLDLVTLQMSLTLAPALLLGLLVGERVHGVVSEPAFRRAIAALLLVCAALVLARSA